MGVRLDCPAVLDELRNHLGFRRIQEGYRALERFAPDAFSFSAETPYYGTLIGLVAQWVDAGFPGVDLVCRLVARFPPEVRGRLQLLDYLHIRMAESMLAMSREEFESAITHLQFVRSFEDEIDDRELMAIANFWTGRCLRRVGRYDDALTYIIKGEELALARGYTPMAALMQTTRSWLSFQKGKLTEAQSLLRRADEVLNTTDDYQTRGNIQSAYGRIARRQGRYEHAIECFEQAIGGYRKGGGGQPQLGRALLNLSFVKRLLALDLQRDLDRASASRRSGKTEEPATAERTRQQRFRIEAMREQARRHLDESMAIFGPRQNHHGIAGVLINSGFLHLDAGELEDAAEDALEAFRHGEEKRDNIVMARARNLQCIVEHAAWEEQLGVPERHQEAAAAFARDAVHYAGETQNRRLLARVYVWQGLTLALDPGGDKEAAQRCYEQALALLQTQGAEPQKQWEEMELLRQRVVQAQPIDQTLRAWSAGVVGGKTFQQLEEEFARIVIPRVWEREGRKVSRVADKLSISPKKVRRILYTAGLLASAGPAKGAPD